MRLIHVTDTFLPKIGGAEIAIDQLIRALIAQGVDCALLAQVNRGYPTAVDVPYRVQRFAHPRSSLWAGARVDWSLRQLAKVFGDVDAVIGHHAFPPGYGAVRFANARNIPSIVYPRGGDIYEMSRLRSKHFAWRRLTWALANASAVVCASQAMEQIVREIIGEHHRSRIVRIPNGVNLAEMQADADDSLLAKDARLQDPFILGLGRLIHRKGFHLLIDAFAQADLKNWKLVIAGDGKEMDALRRQAQPTGDRVIFTGMVEGADKRWLLQHCRFMAAPSLEESFGNVALEAMACGRPVIASNASGFVEMIQPGENGTLIAVGEVSALADALTDYTSRELSKEGSAALQTAEAFSWPNIAKRYVSLVNDFRRPV